MITNVTDPAYQTNPVWRPYYSARESYGKLLFDRPLAAHEPMDGAFWHRVSEGFERDDAAFQEYVQRASRGARRHYCLTSWCKARWINSMRSARSEYRVMPPAPYNTRVTTKQVPGGKELVFEARPAVPKETLPESATCSHHSHSPVKILQRMAEDGSLQVRCFLSDLISKTDLT